MDGRSEQPRRSRRRARMFETRSQSWREVGLLRQISPGALRRARIEVLLFVPLFAGIVYVYDRFVRGANGPLKKLGVPILPVQIVAVLVLVALGWVIARAAGRILGPALFRRMEPATAGTVGFLIRLITLLASLWVALRILGLEERTLAIGGAVAAVILGLAAQQTLGNVIAGTVMLSTRPFRVGDEVRLQGSTLGGPIDGVVSSLGLFYTTFEKDRGLILIPNGVVMNALVISGDVSELDAQGSPAGGAAGQAGAARPQEAGADGSQAGLAGSRPGERAPQAGASGSQAGGRAPQAGEPGAQAGGRAPQAGEPGAQAGGRSPQAGAPGAQAGGRSPQAGEPATQRPPDPSA